MQVSIIIPVYNVETYIEKCLQSVADQTFNGEMECLIIDDCGQDNSMSIAEQFTNNYKGKIHFQILYHDHNRGLSAARNTGIDNAKGDWIYFLDSDDWIIPECIELMFECVKKHPNTDAVYAGTNVINGKHEWADYENRYLPEYTEDQWWINTTLLKRNVLGMTAWNKLFKRELIEKNHLRFIEGLKHEDEVWNMQLSQIINSICIFKKNTYFYLKRNNGIIGKQSTDTQRFYLRLKMWNAMIDHIQGERWQIQNQVKLIASWAIGISCIHYPYIKRLSMPKLLFRLALIARSKLSKPLLWLSLLALIKSPTYKEFPKRHYMGL
ncbi:MAG: glycosyltransferase family 2 protein [Prevotella sp.]|nr:glycosyltransferase family 2 protein [Prevotella sp.]